MKTQNKSLDMDFIGGQDPLTKSEEQELSEFFKNRKISVVSVVRTKKTTNRSKLRV